MEIFFRIILTGLFLVVPMAFGHAVGQPLIASPNNQVALSELQIDLSVKIGTGGVVSPTIRITNMSYKPVTVAAPDARWSIAFIVLDSLGNVVPPTGRAKVDPKTRSVNIGPHESIERHWEKLEFISGSALFGYDLIPGKTYRILAIYRPNGPQAEGVCSREIVVTVK